MQGVIRDPDNSRLQTILRFGDMALKMAGKKGKREAAMQTFTRYISSVCIFR